MKAKTPCFYDVTIENKLCSVVECDMNCPFNNTWETCEYGVRSYRWQWYQSLSECPFCKREFNESFEKLHAWSEKITVAATLVLNRADAFDKTDLRKLIDEWMEKFEPIPYKYRRDI